MLRNCLFAVVLWIVLVGGYAYALRDVPKLEERGDRYPAVLAMASIVWAGTVMATGARYTFRDWQARNRMARGERPLDGDLVAATGPIRPTSEVIHAPLSGRECVIYTYDIGPPQRSTGRTARDYAGFGFARCAVQTRYGTFAIGSFPALEAIPKAPADADAAKAFIEKTAFENVTFMELAKSMFRLHSEPPPFRRDFRIGAPAESGTLEAEEQIIARGEEVTAIGRYVAASSTIVSDMKQKGFLRMSRGGVAFRESAVPGRAILQFFGGLAIIAAANAVLWILTR